MAPLWARHLAPLWARHWPPCGLDIWPPCGPNVSTGTTLTRVPLWLRRRTCPAHHFSAAWPPRTAAGATTAHGCAVCLTAAAPTAKASASSLLAPSLRTLRSHTCPCDCAGKLSTCISLLQCGRRAQRLAPTLLSVALRASQPRPRGESQCIPPLTPSPRAQRSRACLCDCADELSTHITPLPCGRHAQRLAPPPLTDALCASQSRPSRREPVHPHCSRRLHAPDAHARASVIVLAHLPRTSLLCSVAAAHRGWRHHCSLSRCVPHSRDPHGENQCIPTAHTVSTRTTLTRVPLCLRWRTCHARQSSAVWSPRTAAGATTAHGCAVYLTAATPTARARASPLLTLSTRTPLTRVPS